MAMSETYPHIHKDIPRLLFDFSRRIRYTDEADMNLAWYPQGAPGGGVSFVGTRGRSPIYRGTIGFW